MAKGFPCADCDHDDTHSELVGCLADACDCPRYVRPSGRTRTVEQARAEGQGAQDRAERGTDPDWETKAVEVITSLANTVDAWGARERFTADDIWEELERRQVPPPREPRALGPILKRLSKPGGDIHPKGFTESRRRHGAPVRVYTART